MLGPVQLIRAARAVVRITLDPTVLDEVFVLADLSEESAQLAKVVADLKADPTLGPIMAARPRLGPVELEDLAALPSGTLGHEYARFMRARGLEHDSLQLIEGESDVDWVRNHFRESHDLWHVVTGFDTDVAGELGLQAFYVAQIHGPLPVLLLAVGMLNTLFKGLDDADRRMASIARGYLLGRRAHTFFGLPWSELVLRPLDEIREELALDLEAVDTFIAEESPARALAAAA